ncbi:MAG TPA: NAD-dependent epimerase/dehydratase family protein [Stellaceae bacterium]|nr:NAD-dependent epimerase/dehydratase family protein [Stellaceae bacterium]
MRWLVTGGCGFIGRNLVRRLLADGGHRIRILDNFSVGTRADLAAAIGPEADQIELIEGDIRDEAQAFRAAAGSDVVVHLAGNTGVGPSVADPRTDCIANIIGTLNYLEACRMAGVSRFVFASSGATVGECEPPLHEELPGHPVSPYGASKLAGEAYCSAYKRSFGIDTVGLRFGNCYGPFSGHKGSVIAKFIREALAGQPWEIYGNGSQTRDFIYVDDVIDAINRAATVGQIGGEIFQVATNIEITISELVERLAAVFRLHGIELNSPVRTAPRTGDVNRNYSDTTKARHRLDWTAQITLQEGLKRTVAWFLLEDQQQCRPPFIRP